MKAGKCGDEILDVGQKSASSNLYKQGYEDGDQKRAYDLGYQDGERAAGTRDFNYRLR